MHGRGGMFYILFFVWTRSVRAMCPSLHPTNITGLYELSPALGHVFSQGSIAGIHV
jgi:hypothetical protein